MVNITTYPKVESINMQVFVINLERDLERRHSIEKQLKTLNLNFEFFKAYYGKDLTPGELSKHFNPKRAYRNYSYKLSPAHIGCSLSHVMLYKKIIDNNIAVACIFEDDIVLPHNTKIVLDEIKDFISHSNPQVILLSPSKPMGKVLFKFKGYSIRAFKSGFFTSSYIINQAAADILYNHLYPVKHVADCWEYLKRHRIIDIYSLCPGLIEQDQVTFGSSTNAGQAELNIYKHASTINYKLHRLIFKTLDYLVAFFNRNFRPYRSN